MARYFEGTSTGNKYEVGQRYLSGDGSVKVAQADGSFVKEGNLVSYTDSGKPIVDNAGRGAWSAGSSGNPDVNWWQDSGTSSASVSSPATGQSVRTAAGRGSTYGSSEPMQTNSGSGVMRVANPNSGALAGRVAAAGQGLRIAKWSGIDDPAQHYMVAGQHMVASPRSSNMAMVEERHGDAEFLSPAWFASWGIAADDYVYNLSLRTYGSDHENRQHRQEVQKAAVEDLGESVMDWAFSSVAGVRSSAAAAAQGRKEVDEAWDYRMDRQALEGRKAGDWTAIPEVWDQKPRFKYGPGWGTWAGQ